MLSRRYKTAIATICASLTALVLFAGIAAACEGGGGGEEEGGGCPAPSVTTDIATSVGEVSATLGGIVDPQGCVTTYSFEWGPSSSPKTYPNSVTRSAGTVAGYQLETIFGLQPSTGYHFRLSATNEADTTYGADKTFTTAGSGTVHDPILFVHGWKGSEATWTTMIKRFEAQGWPKAWLKNFAYDWSKSNILTAQLIAEKVTSLRQATGAAKVDIITHSMGALSSRYYLKKLGGTAVVEDWVSLAGPNHGTNLGYACQLLQDSCFEMIPGSSFLTILNSGDETPGSVRYMTVRGECDPVINPDDSVILTGAVKNLPWWPATACITSHEDIHEDWYIFTVVESFVR